MLGRLERPPNRLQRTLDTATRKACLRRLHGMNRINLITPGLTCNRERTTWYGYVSAIANSFAVPDMPMYSRLDCRWIKEFNKMGT